MTAPMLTRLKMLLALLAFGAATQLFASGPAQAAEEPRTDIYVQSAYMYTGSGKCSYWNTGAENPLTYAMYKAAPYNAYCENTVTQASVSWNIEKFRSGVRRTSGYELIEYKSWTKERPACTRDDTSDWKTLADDVTEIGDVFSQEFGVTQGVIVRAIMKDWTGTTCAYGYVYWLRNL